MAYIPYYVSCDQYNLICFIMSIWLHDVIFASLIQTKENAVLEKVDIQSMYMMLYDCDEADDKYVV